MRCTSLLMIATLCAALLVLPVLNLAAQAPLYMNVGHRVRLKTDSASQWLIGTLVAADEDSLRLRVADNAPLVSVAQRTVSRFEVRYGGHSNTGRGALIGLGVGAMSGAIVGAASSGCTPGGWCYDPGAATDAVAGAVVFGGAGALLGALIGSTVQSDRWESVSLSRAEQLSLAPRGAGLALSLTF